MSPCQGPPEHFTILLAIMISCLLVVGTGHKNAGFHLGSHACLHRQDRGWQPGNSFSQISIDACISAHCHAGKLAAVPPIGVTIQPRTALLVGLPLGCHDLCRARQTRRSTYGLMVLCGQFAQ